MSDKVATVKTSKTSKTSKTVKEKTSTKKDRSMADVPAMERRDCLVKLLRKLNATSAMTAKPISLLAEKLGYTNYDVYYMCYGKCLLATEEIVKTAKLEEHRDLCIYLTAKGQKTLPSELKTKTKASS